MRHGAHEFAGRINQGKAKQKAPFAGPFAWAQKPAAWRFEIEEM